MKNEKIGAPKFRNFSKSSRPRSRLDFQKVHISVQARRSKVHILPGTKLFCFYAKKSFFVIKSMKGVFFSKFLFSINFLASFYINSKAKINFCINAKKF